MLQSFFTGLSGMFSFSKSLDNVSNNVANMNTPGYRGTNTFIKNISGPNESGYGTTVDSTATRMSTGEIRQTGNETDLAITGNGFFILRDEDGAYFYTRAGQFSFNEDNILVDTTTNYEVMSLTENGNLTRIDISNNRILPPVATSEISFSGNLSSNATDYELTPVTVISANGDSVDLTLQFSNPPATTDSWLVDIIDTNGDILSSNEVRFDGTGSPLTGFNTFDATLNLQGVDQTITFNFGDPGSLNGATQLSSGTSSLGTTNINGNSILGLLNVNFDEDGTINFKYSNGDTDTGPQVALASFRNEGSLERSSGSMFRNNDPRSLEIGKPNSLSYGRVQGGSIELANIELTQEFADMLIIQRGYQASSQVMSVANELIEQLYNSTRR